MTLTYGFFNSLSGDRKYDATDFGQLFTGIITDGVFLNYGGHLAVTPQTGANMNILVASGRAWFNGTWTYNDSNYAITVDASEAVLNRIDAVILEVDSSNGVRANSLKMVKGTPASTPVAPTMVHTSTKNQYALAYIAVNATVVAIVGANITNNIGTAGTPYTTALLDTVTTEELVSQWESEFDLWFNGLVDQLSGVQVTNLQNQINNLTTQQNGWIPHTGSWVYVSNDGSTGVLNINSDMTAKLQKGMRIRYDQSQPLTALWTMNGNSNSAIGSFTMTDTAMSYAAGKIGSAAGFNGTTSKIVITDTALMKPTGDLTLGMWIKTNTAAAYQMAFQSYSRNPTNDAGIQLTIEQTTGFPYMVVAPNLGAGTLTTLKAPINICDNNWHFVVFTLRGNYGQLYVDGVLGAYGWCWIPAYAATNYVRFGCLSYNGTESTFFNGQIDDAFLINGYALDEATIRAKYISAIGMGSPTTVTKYGIITNVSPYGSPVASNTQITFWGGTDFSTINSAITNTYYDHVKVPFGMNVNPDKWSVLLYMNTPFTQNSPTATTWYNTGGNITMPIGLWDTFYRCCATVAGAASQTQANCFVTLSNANNTESDVEMTTTVNVGGSASTYNSSTSLTARKLMETAAKITKYINIKTTVTVSSISINLAAGLPLVVKLTLAYL